ncbi:MAG: hypothetical protein VX822_03205 [Candidatus Neomarinimicrobiota bacterium]|nr:hypothetical protein [Candidatus Neomarinimicrobiota bacterium]
MSRLISILFIVVVTIQAEQLIALQLPNNLQFEMTESEALSVMEAATDSAITIVDRDTYQILTVKFMQVYGKNRVNQLRAFVSAQKGLFSVEEETFLKWDHQQPESENLEVHRRVLESVLTHLRQQYGDEDLLEETPVGERHGRFQHVTATWQFPDERWIHLIYEPQDWSLYPELVKVVVIYRSSVLDPRMSQADGSPNSFRNSKR